MRFSASRFVVALAFGSIASAQIPGVTKLATDLTTLVTHLAVIPPNATALTNDITTVIADVVALVGGAGGINTGGTLPIDAATALVTQITATICPALKTVTGAIITLPVPTNLLSALLRGAIQTVVALLGVLIGTLPLGVIVTPAITCLNSLIPPTILPTSGSATIPLEAAVF